MPKTKPFNLHHAKYEQWFVENRYVYLSEIAAVRHFIPTSAISKGLKIGIGSGQFAHPLKIPFSIYPAASMLKLTLQKEITVLKAVAECLPFKNNLFDFVLMLKTIGFVLHEDNKKNWGIDIFRKYNLKGYIYASNRCYDQKLCLCWT